MKADKEEIFNHVMKKNVFLSTMEFGCLKDWIANCGISVTDFSLLLEISRAHLHKVMSGTTDPSHSLMQKIRMLTGGKFRNSIDLIEPF